MFRIAVTVPDDAEPKVLVEGPADWAPYAPVFAGRDGGKALYDLKFSRLGATTPIAGATIRITMQAAGRAVEQERATRLAAAAALFRRQPAGLWISSGRQS